MSFNFSSVVASVAKKAIAPIIVASLLAGCVTHPIQQDVTGLPTKQIVDRIRCELKFAVLGTAISKLRLRALQISESPVSQELSSTQISHIVSRLNVIADDLARQGEIGGSIDFDTALLPTPRAVRFYNHFINSGVAYDFTFDISEMNTSALAVDPVRLITGGNAGLTVGAGFDRTRSNIRRFQLTDTFAGLLANDELACGQQDTTSPNLVYPVAGNIGLNELIRTFVDLSEGQLLQTLSPQGGSVFGDTLKFTTAVSGGVTPHVEIAAAGNRFGLAAPATARLNASRSDVHMLAISLSMGAEGDVPLPQTVSIRLRKTAGRPMPTPGLRATANVRRAMDNLVEQRARNITDNLGALIGR